LRDLKYKVSDEKKYNYLYATLPDDLIIESNMIIYHGKWNATVEHLKSTIPHLIYFKELKSKTIKNKKIMLPIILK